VQTIPDKQLAAVGAKRCSCIRVPYFGVAMQCLPGTELILTLTSGMTRAIKNDRRLRLVKAPQELHAFHFLMAWHPRLTTDPRHVWLREAVRSSVDLNGHPQSKERVWEAFEVAKRLKLSDRSFQDSYSKIISSRGSFRKRGHSAL
jgi:hypothetical protein